MAEDQHGKKDQKDHGQEMPRKDIADHLLGGKIDEYPVDKEKEGKPEQHPPCREREDLYPLFTLRSSKAIPEPHEPRRNEKRKHPHRYSIPAVIFRKIRSRLPVTPACRPSSSEVPAATTRPL
jgi:hypothetical protein